jgi:hypothetical protein
LPVNTPKDWDTAVGGTDVAAGRASMASSGPPGESEPLSITYERQAEAEERSALPWILRITRFLAWIVYAVVLVEAALLATAFFLRLAGANPASGFASWVYRSADRSMAPFRGIFPTHELSGASVLDLSLLFAAVVYVVIGLVIDAGLRWLGRQLSDRERRVAQLRAAARDAATREYELAQRHAGRP